VSPRTITIPLLESGEVASANNRAKPGYGFSGITSKAIKPACTSESVPSTRCASPASAHSRLPDLPRSPVSSLRFPDLETPAYPINLA
jgi:hypothetical protein